MGDGGSRPQTAAAGPAARNGRAAQRFARRAADERRAQRLFRRAVHDARAEGAHGIEHADGCVHSESVAAAAHQLTPAATGGAAAAERKAGR